MSFSATVQQAVRARAQGRCEYCHSPEWVCAARFTLDHLLPRSLGGSDASHNLALACRRCNERRYTFMTGQDPATGQEVPLFHPVREVWAAHFAWTPDGQWIIGQTPTGRATGERLDLNDERHDDGFIRMSRALWVQGGWHPPTADPIVPHAFR
ncbi:MAG: HNH endonuclease [Nitrospinae bacterium]|nr:HNH endonuclease [Nitrospinota bacterium]